MTSYKNRLMLDLRPSFEGLNPSTHDDNTFDSVGSGQAVPWRASTGVRRRVSYRFILDRDQFLDLRSLFAWSVGKLISFWVPIIFDQYRLTVDAAKGATVLTVQNIGLASAFSLSQFKHLVLLSWGKQEAYEIESVVANGDTETITLTSGLTTALDSTQTICGGLIAARFDDDPEFIFHSTDTIETEVSFIECPDEYDAASETKSMMWLYKITQGDKLWRYAAWVLDTRFSEGSNEDVIWPWWFASDISHERLGSDSELSGDEVQLTVVSQDSTHPLKQFVTPGVINPVTVTIYRHTSDNEQVMDDEIVFVGRVNSVQFGTDGRMTASLTHEGNLSDSRYPSVQVQRTCNYRLFDEHCGVAEASYSVAGEVSAFNNQWIESSAFGAKLISEDDSNWFARGRVRIGDETRAIVGCSGNRLYISAPFKKLGKIDRIVLTRGGSGYTSATVSFDGGCTRAATARVLIEDGVITEIILNDPGAGYLDSPDVTITGDGSNAMASAWVETTATATAGCDGRSSTCEARFNNLGKCMAFPYLPNQNPQFKALETPKASGGKK